MNTTDCTGIKSTICSIKEKTRGNEPKESTLAQEYWKSYFSTINPFPPVPCQLPIWSAVTGNVSNYNLHSLCRAYGTEYFKQTVKRTCSCKNDRCKDEKPQFFPKETNGKDEKPRFRRCRTRFTKQQVATLEKAFSEIQYPSVSVREKVAAETKLSEARVQVWFSNRRAKWRRENDIKWMTQKQNQKAVVPYRELKGDSSIPFHGINSKFLYTQNLVPVEALKGILHLHPVLKFP